MSDKKRYRSTSQLEPGFGQRMIQAREALGNLSQAALGEMIGCRDFTLSRYEREIVNPDGPFLWACEYRANIRRAWIERGELPMFKTVQECNPSIEDAQLVLAIQRHLQELNADLETVPVGAGMTEFAHGDTIVVLPRADTPLVRGSVYFLDTRNPTIGKAYPSQGGAWLLYHDLDKEDPGTYSPTLVEDPSLCRQVIAVFKWVIDPASLIKRG